MWRELIFAKTRAIDIMVDLNLVVVFHFCAVYAMMELCLSRYFIVLSFAYLAIFLEDSFIFLFKNSEAFNLALKYSFWLL